MFFFFNCYLEVKIKIYKGIYKRCLFIQIDSNAETSSRYLFEEKKFLFIHIDFNVGVNS